MNKILVVVDMQNDFISGCLGTAEAEKIVPRVLEKIAEYEKNGDKVVFTRDTHSSLYSETQEGRKLPISHCVMGTRGWEIDERLKKDAMVIFDKPTFGSLSLAEFITSGSFTEIELCGVCTDICVITNALLLKTFLPEAEIKVDSTACAGTTPENHENALSAMKMCQIDIR